jgi:hypothetical protein
MPERRRLLVIPAAKVKPKKMIVMEMGDEGRISGDPPSGIQWECGACGHLLADGLRPGQLTNVVMRCPCGAYNDASV